TCEGGPVSVTPSRRAVLTAAAVGAAGLRLGTAAGASRVQPLPATSDPVLHAVRRLSYGPTPTLMSTVRQMGVQAWVADQLASKTLADPQTDALVETFATSRLPAPALNALMDEGLRDPVGELQTATTVRAAWGERQLGELLVELWSNHFSIDASLTKVRAFKVPDDRDVVRAHALGTFRDLLQASAQSPAMLSYLDNAISRGDRPNENYARELLELHTVGVHGGYVQRDVRNAALVFTGWTVDATTGAFRYEPTWHHVGPVAVMGWQSDNRDPAAGVAVGQSLLDYLAAHPATARRIATKLVRRFVDDEPPGSLVESTAAVLRANGTAVIPAVEHIVASAEFARSAGRKTRRPFEWFVASVRALGLSFVPYAGLTEDRGINDALGRLGQLPFGWHPPDGYPDLAVVWTSTASLLTRWDLAQALVSGGVSGLQAFDAKTFLGTPVPATAGALVDAVAARILGAPPRPGLREPLVRSLGKPSAAALTAAEATALTPELAALVLSSPDMQVR
ncbi:MAG: DUF1800 domain-containing protein, partial [Actinomycetota bacterium]|nr:DUF1800 domain-containing protein [Actinomycetota bacterium]